MINKTILFLTVSDCSNDPIIKRGEVDGRVNHNFEISTIDPLKKIFSNVIVYDYLKRYVEVGVKRTNQEILDIVNRKKPEYVFWPSMNYEISESTFDKIRQQGSTVIGWFFDDEVRFDDYSKWWIPHLDYILTTDKESIKKYQTLGGTAIYSLNFSNSDYFKKIDIDKIYDISFVGTNIANRQELMNSLKDNGVNVRTFGRGWSSSYVSFDEMVKIYNQSKINMSFMQSYGNSTRPQMKCKIFDICLCGGFLLCEYIPGIEDYYEIGKEIECFNTLEEAASNIQYYLKNEVEREVIADAGWKRAVSEHTNLISFSKIFKEIERDIVTKRDKEIINLRVSEMPKDIRKLHSNFHFHWGKARLIENHKKLWNEELALSLHYNPFNFMAWSLYIIGYFPHSARPLLVKISATIFAIFAKPKLLVFSAFHRING